MKEYGPSQSREMIRGLTEAAKERREELILTYLDVAFFEACGIEAPANAPGKNEKTLGRQILERFWAEDR